jgi:hypothetical protein
VTGHRTPLLQVAVYWLQVPVYRLLMGFTGLQVPVYRLQVPVYRIAVAVYQNSVPSQMITVRVGFASKITSHLGFGYAV